MSTFEDKVCAYGKAAEKEPLEQLIQSTKVEEIEQLIVRRIHHPSFMTFLNYLLDGVSGLSQPHKKRFQIVKTLLKEFQQQVVTTTQKNSIITRLCYDLSKFKSEDLVELFTVCTRSLQKGTATELYWIELLPATLHELVNRESIEYDGEELSGEQCKAQLIAALLVMEWSPSIITPLTDMFTTVPLTKEEHAQVFNKLVQQMEKLTPQEVPAFVYQLLRLCSTQDSRALFMRLQHYFGLRVYNNVTLMNQNSENIDAIADSSDVEAVQAESTVHFHIYTAASIGHESINDYLNSLKNLIRSPEFILHPFQLSVLLTISTISFCEEKVFEIIKPAITRFYQEEHKKADSCWFREMLPASENQVTTVIIQLITLSVEERDLVLQGLVNLSFVLLATVPSLGRESIVKELWSLGKLIIVKLLKHKMHISHTIVQRISNCIMTGQNVHQYIDCLHILSRKFGLAMLENKSCIVELMEQLLQVSGSVANSILDAILPLTKISPTIRDHLILLLRKALYSRSMETRQMTVCSFLKLLKNLKVSNMAALSQSSNHSSSFSSGISILTQISLTSTRMGKPSAFSNEALCMEMLRILSRCFMQHAEVKSKLYEGLYDAVCMNPDLGVPILDLMWTHFTTFYVSDDDVLPPLNFSEAIQLKNCDAVLLEPLGKFLYATSLISSKVQEQEDMENQPVVIKFVKVFDNLTTKMGQCDLEHFQLNDGTDIFDILPECQEKMLVLCEAISVYEALIGYNVFSWGQDCVKKAETIMLLFETYRRLVQLPKNLTKPKKDKRKKGSPNKTTQNDSTLRKDGASKKSFKLPPTVLDFHVLAKLLQLLHNKSVSFTSTQQATILKRNVDMHQYAMTSVMGLVKQFRQMKHLDEETRQRFYNPIFTIATVLYTKCVSNFKEIYDFDATTGLLSLECFHEILRLVDCHYKDKLISFFSIVSASAKDDIVVHLTEFIEMFENLFEMHEDDFTTDPDMSKVCQTIITTLTLLSNHIPTVYNNPLSAKILDWTKCHAAEHKLVGRILVNSFATFLFKLHVKFKTTTTLFKNYAIKLGAVFDTISDEEMENVEDIAFVDEGTVNTILQCMCNEIKAMLDDLDWIILRIRSEHSMITYPGETSIERRREYLKSKERSVCCQICQIIAIMTIVSNISAPPGPCCEAIIKINTHLFNTLTNLTKYFMMRSSKVNVVFQSARFDGVVKAAGKKLAPTIYRLITHIEKAQREIETATQAKKKKKDANVLKSKVLRDTRPIPKLILEIEQFSKTVTQLSNKTKVDLAKYIGQGTTRDFRISDLKTAMQEAGVASNAATQETTQGSVMNESSDVVESDNSDNEQPAPKKSKK